MSYLAYSQRTVNATIIGVALSLLCLFGNAVFEGSPGMIENNHLARPAPGIVTTIERDGPPPVDQRQDGPLPSPSLP